MPGNVNVEEKKTIMLKVMNCKVLKMQIGQNNTLLEVGGLS